MQAKELPLILADILHTGEWKLVAQSNRLQDLIIYDGVVRVQRDPPVMGPDKDLCLSLWTERQYGLSIDGPLVEVPDCCAHRGALLEARFKPVHARGAVTPPSESIILHKVRARSDHCRVPIFIPSIPRFLDAELDRYQYNIERKMRNPNPPFVLTEPIHALQLIHHLHLDLQCEMSQMLRELAPRHRPMMERLVGVFVRAASSSRPPTFGKFGINGFQ